jgi:hypothetical protein
MKGSLATPSLERSLGFAVIGFASLERSLASPYGANESRMNPE